MMRDTGPVKTNRAATPRITLLTRLLVAAVLVSIVHYVDSVANFSDYPKSSVLPNPSALVIGASWFAFSAAGLAGYILYRRSQSETSLLLLGLYSGSGLVGILHYSVPGALDMPWWRHAHVLADIALGAAILGFAIWAARSPKRAVAGSAPRLPTT